MEAIRSSETSGTTQRTTRRHIPEEDTLQTIVACFFLVPCLAFFDPEDGDNVVLRNIKELLPYSFSYQKTIGSTPHQFHLYICSSFAATVRNSDHISPNAGMVVNNQVEGILKEAVVV
jgi:hypothetical protein